MSQLILATVLMLMVSIGMSLDRGQILANWRRQSGGAWVRLLLATFVLPPALVLVLYRILPLGRGPGIGLLLAAALLMTICARFSKTAPVTPVASQEGTFR